MPRRPRSDDDDISLFPFLSIIASVIGVLTMMIATLALAQTDKPDVAQIEEYEQTKKEMLEAEDAIEALKRKISVSNSAALELQEDKKALQMTIEDLEAMLAELERIEKELAEQKKVQIVIPKLNPKDRETATEMTAQLGSIREEIAQLEKDIQLRKDVPTEGNVTVLPQGSGLNFTPHFVECAKDSIVMHNLPEPKRIRTGEVVADKDFIALMNLVANGKDDSIVFLVRSDAVKTYRSVRGIVSDRELRNGKIPVVGQGRIDLSAFNKKRK